MSITLSELLQRVPEDTQGKVEQTRKRFGPALREIVRHDTGLMLNRQEALSEATVSEANVSVPVNVTAGIPTALRELKFDENHWLATETAPYRADLQNLSGIIERLMKMSDTLQNDVRANEYALGVARMYRDYLEPVDRPTKELLEKLKKSNPVQQILAVNEDVLGTYGYRSFLYGRPSNPSIRLHWAIIGLVAQMLGVNVELLTVVVLAHELAHSYTHLGADIDGSRWSDAGFYESDLYLIEGLAQYYTDLACRRLECRLPGLLRTFTELLQYQPDVYWTHATWIDEKYTAEEVRLAMLDVRRRPPVKVDAFCEALALARHVLRVQRPEERPDQRQPR